MIKLAFVCIVKQKFSFVFFPYKYFTIPTSLKDYSFPIDLPGIHECLFLDNFIDLYVCPDPSHTA